MLQTGSPHSRPPASEAMSHSSQRVYSTQPPKGRGHLSPCPLSLSYPHPNSCPPSVSPTPNHREGWTRWAKRTQGVDRCVRCGSALSVPSASRATREISTAHTCQLLSPCALSVHSESRVTPRQRVAGNRWSKGCLQVHEIQ